MAHLNRCLYEHTDRDKYHRITASAYAVQTDRIQQNMKLFKCHVQTHV